MSKLIKSIAMGTVLPALALAVVACGPPHTPPITVNDLMEDRVVLDGVLLKCSRTPSRINSDIDCLNARIAIERLAKVNELGNEKKHAEEFEQVRERLRVAQDLQRQKRESSQKVDVYNLPVIPVEPSSSDKSVPAAATETSPSLIGQIKP